MASKILLADDSITIQKVVNLTFADEGIEVVAVNNGDVAERRLSEVNPDLVLADIFMPGKNGYELCDAIKQNPQFRNVPVVLLVGAFEPFDQAEARRVRADAHLTKPFESRTLVETVRRLINAAWRPIDGPSVSSPAPDQPHDDIRSDRDTGSDQPPLSSPPGLKLDLTAMMADNSAAASTGSVRSTGELASRAPDSGAPAFEVSFTDPSAHEPVTATLAEPNERFEAMEFSSNDLAPDEMSSPSAPQDAILDFDRAEGLESSPKYALSFDPDLADVLEVDVNGSGEEGRSFDGDRVAATRGETVSVAICDDASAPSPAMLAVDEPLGDVLDEATPMESRPPQDHTSDDFRTADLQRLEAPEGAVASTQFDLVEIGNESPLADFGDLDVNVEPSRFSKEAVALADQMDPLDDISPLESDPPSRQVNPDWTTPHAGAYSTAQLDSVMMPVGTEAYLSEHSLKEAKQPEASPEASFSTPTMWTEEETRFTPIDIEAVPVEEADVSTHPLTESETTVSVSPAASGPLTSQTESQAVNAASQPGNGGTPPPEMSGAAIEEIVRRVITEMSDSVVREVAWEVVPDCVERIVGQLMRESLSKRA